MANNIGNINPLLPQQNAGLQGGKQNIPAVPDDGSKGGVVIDKVEISKQARAISKAAIQVGQLPDIRQDLVDKVTERVQAEKKIPAHELAAKMLLEEQG